MGNVDRPGFHCYSEYNSGNDRVRTDDLALMKRPLYR